MLNVDLCAYLAYTNIMKVFILFLYLTLTACGFQPVYGTRGLDTNIQKAYQSIAISNIPDREGQILRNHLIDRLHLRATPAQPAYVLNVSPINGYVVRLGIARDATTTRAQYEANAYVSLKDMATGDVVLERQVRSLAAFNILSSEFQTVVTEEDAQERVLNDLADQIETQLSLYFSR